MMSSTPTPVLSLPNERSYNGNPASVQEVRHTKALELENATVALTFSLDELPGEMVLISKDMSGANPGHFQVMVRDGIIWFELENSSTGEWLKVPNLVLWPQETYHLAVSMGDDGMMVYVDGVLMASEPDFKVGLDDNKEKLLIGGTRAHRNSDEETPHGVVDGTIGNVAIYDGQLSEMQVASVAAKAGVSDGMAHQMMASLHPAFEQMHHGSEWLEEIAEKYGIGGHGHHGMGDMSGMTMTMGMNDDGRETLKGSAVMDAMDGGFGNDKIFGYRGADQLQGGYGRDTLGGGMGNDVLDGGEGEDTVKGGNGNDLIISRSDAREMTPTYIAGRDEGDPDGELTNGKVYPNQPVNGDDVFEGGKGADIFYFQLLINSKDYFIEKHTNDSGMINWHGVAGENDDLHDHWVDGIGRDVILDYDYDEGDRIVIEGHTTYVKSITYGDANGDGMLDHSIISLYSDQGRNGGAHHLDDLGEIVVYGDLVKEGDLHVDDDPAYGIVHDVAELDEAIRPLAYSKNGQEREGKLGRAEKLPGGLDPVLSFKGTHTFDGEDGDYLDAGHHADLNAKNLTVALRFSLDSLPGNQALIAMDENGRHAGDFTVWSRDGTLWVRQESNDKDKWLKVPDLVLLAEQEYHLAVSFGEDGLMFYLDGELVASEPTFKVGLQSNDNALTVGGTRAWRDDDDRATDRVEGTIEDIHVFDRALSEAEVAMLAGHGDAETAMDADMALTMASLAPVFEQTHHGSDWLMMTAAEYGMAEGHGGMGMDMAMDTNMSGPRQLTIIKGTPGDDDIDGNDTINGAAVDDGIDGYEGNDLLKGWAGDDVIQGNYGNDTLTGGKGNDILDGGHGEDTLKGGVGDDWLISRSDAREPKPTYIAGRDEGDPDGELTNGKVYPDQPVHADDVLEGGRGADIFYFQTLINAKDYFIEKHTNDAGVINWHGVAGENDDLHDHWVDGIGNDRVLDFSHAEGDQIVIEGHTTEIDRITYHDRNGDGVFDTSKIYLYSDQGRNGGAHQYDKLGMITVHGDLVKESDIIQTAAPAYGIVHDIAGLDEAVAPLEESVNTGRLQAPKNLPTGGLEDAVLAVAGRQVFDHEERSPLIFDPMDETSTRNGTVSMSFAIDEMRWQALFSKDAEGYGSGGHLTVYVEEDGDLVMRLQEDDAAHYLVARGAIEVGQVYDLAVTFGSGGAALYLDGVRVAYDPELTQGLGWNHEHVVVGATAWSSETGTTDDIRGYFGGEIIDFAFYDKVMDVDDLNSNSAREGILVMPGWADQFAYGMDNGVVTVTGKGQEVKLDGDVRFLEFRDMTVAVDDIQVGGGGDDHFIGEDGSDILRGRRGNDKLEGKDNDDYLSGDDGNDSLYGGDGKDRLIGGAGSDSLDGGDQNDKLYGGEGYDTLKGNDGKDDLYGGWGDDELYGHTWSFGGEGNDRDTAHYNGNFADYTIAVQEIWNGSRGEYVDRLIITDRADGGFDGVYEGRDLLMDIEVLEFADQTVLVDDLNL